MININNTHTQHETNPYENYNMFQQRKGDVMCIQNKHSIEKSKGTYFHKFLNYNPLIASMNSQA